MPKFVLVDSRVSKTMYYTGAKDKVGKPLLSPDKKKAKTFESSYFATKGFMAADGSVHGLVVREIA